MALHCFAAYATFATPMCLRDCIQSVDRNVIECVSDARVEMVTEISFVEVLFLLQSFAPNGCRSCPKVLTSSTLCSSTKPFHFVNPEDRSFSTSALASF
jgi:hypothetical protein